MDFKNMKATKVRGKPRHRDTALSSLTVPFPGRCLHRPEYQEPPGYENGTLRMEAHFSIYSRRVFQAISSLESQKDLPFEVYDRVVTEPTEASWRDAIAWARQHDCSHFLA